MNIIVIKVNVSKSTSHNLFHFIATVNKCSEKGSVSLKSNFFLEEERKSKINKYIFVESVAPHDVFILDVPVNNVE